MAPAPQSASHPALAALSALVFELFARSEGARYGLSLGDWECLLAEVAAKYLPVAATSADTERFLLSLRVEELALARACAAGHESAWEVFLTRFRAKLFEAAHAIVHEEATARELADSLYADLYGANTRDGERKSKLRYYSGRGSLEGWLRTVLTQEYVNHYRQQKRTVSLDEEEESGHQFVAADPDSAPDADPRLAPAVDEALSRITGEDRLILVSYFLDQRTLAEVARMVGVHESTISRRVEKLVRNLRSSVLEQLRQRGMSARQAEEALEADVRDLAVNVRGRLQEKPPGSFSIQDGKD